MKILILSASVGSGHMSAAWAVETALRELAPEATVRLVDVLEEASPVFRALYGGGYMRLAAQAPHLVGYLYDRSNGAPAPGRPSLAGRARAAAQRAGVPGLETLLLEGDWDAVVCTHFLPAELAASLKRRGRLGARLITAVTDFDAHRIWAHEPCDRYLVASDEAAASLRRFGARPEAIAVTGIPVQPAFARLPSVSSARRGLGLRDDEPVALLLGGGCGLGPMDALFDSLQGVERPLQVVAVSGRNDALRARLSLRAALAGKGARVLGFTRRMSDLMRAADVVVTKPGGLTVSEALACGTPLALVEPLPGQETRNADFALENGAAIKVNHPASLGRKVEDLLRRPERLGELKAAARRLGRPVSAYDAARECLAPAGSLVKAGA